MIMQLQYGSSWFAKGRPIVAMRKWPSSANNLVGRRLAMFKPCDVVDGRSGNVF